MLLSALRCVSVTSSQCKHVSRDMKTIIALVAATTFVFETTPTPAPVSHPAALCSFTNSTVTIYGEIYDEGTQIPCSHVKWFADA